MLKNHPKGLIIAFFTNMGERFGFYTMMAILVLFLQAKYGLSFEQAGDYYSWFYFAIYALALIGGIVADWTKKYKSVILVGQVIMFAGYAMMALPSMSLMGTLIALFIIALGNGFFKGNLQAVVGQLYDDEKYAKYRDSAFMIFYMGINIGAFFAPFVATGVRDWWLHQHGFSYDGSLPALAHQMLEGSLADTTQFQTLANKVMLNGSQVTNLQQFANDYLGVFNKGYNLAFGVAGVAMVLSLLVYMVFFKYLPSGNKVEKVEKTQKAEPEKQKSMVFIFGVAILLMALTTFVIQLIPNLKYDLGLAVGLFVAFIAIIFQMSTQEERARVISLILVFIVVIFFWMSFHQNGLTLTQFALNYTVKEVGAFTSLFFNLWSILAVISTVVGLFLVVRAQSTFKERMIGIGVTLLSAVVCYLFIYNNHLYYTSPQEFEAQAGWLKIFFIDNKTKPEVFQSFNPLFIVSLTPMIMGIFSYLNNKGLEPSTPKKIGIGMIIAGVAFIIMVVSSLNVVSPHELQFATADGGVAYHPVPDASRISPYWLISTYLTLTVAELFLSPMGLSFVSKVAPPRFQGLMQGGWLLATAVGNKFLFIGSALWGHLDLYMLWAVFTICCFVSAIFIFMMMKRLEKVTKD